jgi:hypothetical protein
MSDKVREDCYDRDTLLAYVMGALERGENASLETHMAGCDVCCVLIGRMLEEHEDAERFTFKTYELGVLNRARASVAATPAPAGSHLSRFLRRLWPPLPLIVVAETVALLTIGALWWGSAERYRRAAQQSADTLLSLKDGSGTTALLRSAEVSLPLDAPPDVRVQAATLLSKGMVPLPAAVLHEAANASAREAVAGAPVHGGPSLIAPVVTAVRTVRPAFVWSPVPAAEDYRLYVMDDRNMPVVDVSTRLATGYVLPEGGPGLKPGAAYRWMVQAAVGGAHRPSERARFWVLDSDDSAEVARLEERLRASALLLAAVYESHGLFDDAQAQIQALAGANPLSPIPGVMKEQLQKLRNQP